MRKTTVNLSDAARHEIQEMKQSFGSFRSVIEFAIHNLYNGFYSNQLRPPSGKPLDKP